MINVKSVYERYQAFFAGTSKEPPQVRDRSQQDREEERKAPPVGRPRHVALRVLLTILLLIGAYVVPGLIWVGPSGGGSQGSNAGSGVGTWLLLAEYAWLARKVSYRWFDCLFAMIPFYGIFWMLRIMWRIAYLPFADWTPRPEEASNWEAIAGTEGVKRQVYRSRR